MNVTGSDQHSSLLRNVMNYDRKSIMISAPGALNKAKKQKVNLKVAAKTFVCSTQSKCFFSLKFAILTIDFNFFLILKGS